MKENQKTALAWLSKGDNDLKSAEILLQNNAPTDTAAYHCQQSIEKYLKGFIAYSQKRIPFTHDLEELADICYNIDNSLSFSFQDLVEITSYAVELRYNLIDEIEKDDIIKSLNYAKNIRTMIEEKVMI